MVAVVLVVAASGALREAVSQAAGPVVINVDAVANGHPISPLIYGVGGDSLAYHQTMGVGLRRWGGNQTSRSNWENNDSNAGSDYGPFCNVWQATGASQVPGKAGLDFVNGNKGIGAASLLTIPMIGWVAKDGNNSTCSSGVPGDGGPPVSPGAEAIAGYDPTANRQRTSIASYPRKGAAFSFPPATGDSAVYQDEWVNYLVTTFGPASAGGVRFYAMDNEHDLWSSTHRDVHPVRVGYDELLSRYTAYADAVKAVDPTAEVTAPVSQGWTNYWFSALDKGNNNYATHADRNAHGGLPYLQWFLQQAQAHDTQVGHRTLDVLDVHYYPQGGEYSSDTSPATQALRMRSTRDLWDPTYRNEAWMVNTEGGPNIQVIPRLKSWISQYYPGTKLGISEWNWGAETHINGALAIADVLGIFGREDVYLANYWTSPPDQSPGYWAWRMYRNYDGAQSRFGDVAVQAAADPAAVNGLSAYGSTDSGTGALKLMVLNKLPSTQQAITVNLAHFNAAGGQVYQYSQGNPSQITRLADLGAVGTTLNYTLAPYSITLFVLSAGAGGPTATPTATTLPATPTRTPTPGTTATSTATAAATAQPSFTTSASVTPNSVAAGGTATITAAVTSATAMTALVDLEVYDPGGAKVFQQAYDNQSFTAGQTRSYSPAWSVPTSAVSGQYTVKIGVFSPGWGTLYAWNDSAGQFSVGASPPTATAPPAATATPTARATATQTPLPSATATRTVPPSATATHTPQPPATATRTPLPSAIATQTPLPSATATWTPSPSPTATPTNTATPATSPVLLVGNQTVQANRDSNPAGMAEAFRFTASASGTADQLSIYLDSRNNASRVVVGLYTSNASNNPGTLLAQATISSPVSGAWNTVAIPATNITAGAAYWLAVLGPEGSGTVQFRDLASGGARTQTSSQKNLTTLPATWSPGTTYANSPVSAYAAHAP
jgi:hypothetical protein